MKKILSGIFFSMIKSPETWAFIVLLLIASLYIDFLLVDYGVGFYSFEQYANVEERGYRFIELGVSAHDAYWIWGEPISDESFEILTKTSNIAGGEAQTFVMILCVNIIFPVLVMMIFIPVFYGRMFSDGTVKNLVACGYSKGMIYMSSLVSAFIFDIALYFISLISLFIICLFARWVPPVYLPVVAAEILVLLLLVFTMSAVSLAALFISYSRVICAIAGFILAVLMAFPVGDYSFCMLTESFDFDYESYEELKSIVAEKGYNVFDEKLDLSGLITRTYYEGREVGSYKDSNLSSRDQVLYLATVYMDPYQAAHIILENYLPVCLMVRDGFMAINAASNVFWILLFTGAGITVFRKREIPS